MKRQWIHPLNGSKNIAEIRTGKRGTEYFCLYITDGAIWPRPVIEMRMSTLKEAAVWVVELAEANPRVCSPEWLESLLDFIYLELNRRLNKTI